MEKTQFIRHSFGYNVHYDFVKRSAYIFCKVCNRRVRVNGPGSESTMVARVLRRAAYKITPDIQECFTPAADAHDIEIHLGSPTPEHAKRTNKRYRWNCYQLSRQKWEPIVENMRNAINGRTRPAFITALFDSEARALWSHYSQMDQAISNWKNYEKAAELHYTLLQGANLFESMIPRKPCNHKERADESDCWKPGEE